MANTYVRHAGTWRPVGETVAPPAPSPPPPPPNPITVDHGSDLAATSFEVASQIGPRGELTQWDGGTTLSGTQVIENRVFGFVRIAAGADITMRNCRVISGLGTVSYAINHTAGGESRLTMEDCEIVTRTVDSFSPRCIAVWNPGNFRAVRTIFRGGIDNCYFNAPASGGVFSTGDPQVPMARIHLSECWFGDIQRVATSHSDGMQFDGGGFAVIDRCRIMGYSLPVGSDPLETRVTDPDTAPFASGPIIATQNSSNPSQLSNIVVKSSRIEGGNYTVDLNPGDGLPPNSMTVRDCEFGYRFNFGPLRLPPGSINVNNRWGNGPNAGQPLSG